MVQGPALWRFCSFTVVLLSAVVLLCAHTAAARDVPTVAAAADLRFALDEVAEAFREETGREVRIAYGSSGNVARQIRRGAPFELFLSADERYAHDVIEAGATDGDGALYAVGRIVIMVPNESPLRPDGDLRDLGDALARDEIARLAIANPTHAPYGQRAAEALRHAGLWEAVQDKLVLGENVSQATQFALSGAADGGIVAYSLALAPNLEARGRFALIPEEWHSPLRQRMVLARDAGDTARAFYRFVLTDAARGILARYGFDMPEDES